MSEFLGLLKKFKDDNKEFVISIDGSKRSVKVNDITGDMVTFYEQGNNNRYDLHYTHVVICSLR